MKIAPYIMIYNNYNIIAYKDFYSNNKIKKDKKIFSKILYCIMSKGTTNIDFVLNTGKIKFFL